MVSQSVSDVPALGDGNVDSHPEADRVWMSTEFSNRVPCSDDFWIFPFSTPGRQGSLRSWWMRGLFLKTFEVLWLSELGLLLMLERCPKMSSQAFVQWSIPCKKMILCG